MKRSFAFTLALLVATIGSASQSAAQSYPTRTIRMIVPNPAGGGVDIFARVVAEKMSEALGQPIIIENRLGARGTLGMAAGAKAPPDGYTLTVAFNGTMAISPHLYRKPGFDAVRDFVAISRGVVVPEVLVAHPTVPAKTLKDLAALARAQPGKLTFGSAGATGQLAVEMFKQAAKADLLHVPYSGGPPVMIDLIAGYIDSAVMSTAYAAPFHKAGKVRALVITGPERAAVLPGVPSAPEAGMPSIHMVNWYAIVAPAGTPRDIVAKLNAEINRALARSDVKDRLNNAGLTPKGSTPEEMAALIRSDYERFGKLVKDANFPVD